MDRIQHSVSWNHPKDQGQETQSPSAAANESPPSATNAVQHEKNSDWKSSSDLFDPTSWSRPASYRSFLLPLHYTPSYSYPLVIWLHSNGFNESQVEHVMPHVSTRNYVALGVRGTKAADAVGHRFDWHQSPAGIAAAHESVADAIDESTERFSIDRSRIVLAGYREGGSMAMRVAMRQPDQFAGVISLGGRMPSGAIRNLDELRRNRLSMLWQWATDGRDITDQITKDCRAALAISARVEIRQYPGEDEMDTVILKDVDRWIMQRVVAQGPDRPSVDRWASNPTAYSAN